LAIIIAHVFFILKEKHYMVINDYYLKGSIIAKIAGRFGIGVGRTLCRA